MHSGLNSGTEWWTTWLIGGKSNASVGAKFLQLAILAMFLVSNFTCRTRYRPITTAGDLRCIHFLRKQCNFQQLHKICISRGNVQLQKHLNEILSKSAQKRIETVDFWPIYSKSTLQCVRFGRRWSWCIYGLRSMIDMRVWQVCQDVTDNVWSNSTALHRDVSGPWPIVIGNRRFHRAANCLSPCIKLIEAWHGLVATEHCTLNMTVYTVHYRAFVFAGFFLIATTTYIQTLP